MTGEALTAIATVAAGAFSFVAGRWVRSGRVASTDADTLWQQSQGLIDRLMNRVEVLEAALAGLRIEAREKDGRIEAMGVELAALRFELMQKDERIAHLEHERERLAGRIAELERELAHIRAGDEYAGRVQP